MKEMLPALNFYKIIRFFYAVGFGAVLTLGCGQLGFAQGSVGIGTVNPDESAVLDIVSTAKGVLVPRLTPAQRDLIAAPKNGLLVYNTTDLKFNYWNGAKWEEVGGGIAWFSGRGQPAGASVDKARLNDLYLDELTGDIYQRVLSGFPPPALAWARLGFEKRNKKQVASTAPPVNAGAYYTQTFNFVGATPANAVACSPSFSLPDGIIIAHAWVSANDVISVKFYNSTGGPLAIAGDYQIAIF